MNYYVTNVKLIQKCICSFKSDEFTSGPARSSWEFKGVYRFCIFHIGEQYLADL